MSDSVEWFRPGVPLRAQRVTLTVAARYRTIGEERWHLGRTENISQSGLLIRGARLFSQHAKVEVVVTLPAGILGNVIREKVILRAGGRVPPPPPPGSLPTGAAAGEQEP